MEIHHSLNPYAQAVSDYYAGKEHVELKLTTIYGLEDRMPVEVFFRDKKSFSELEKYAISLCKGKTLDAGAGIGAITLELQERGIDCTALEVEQGLVDIMVERGVNKTLCANFFEMNPDKYDTILMMMNGIGLVGTLDGLENFLGFAKQFLKPGGQLLVDSSDISYFYETYPKPSDRYFGEIAYQYQYEGVDGPWFNWLYIDFKLLKQIASRHGWNAQLIYEDETNQYLARLFLRNKVKK